MSERQFKRTLGAEVRWSGWERFLAMFGQWGRKRAALRSARKITRACTCGAAEKNKDTSRLALPPLREHEDGCPRGPWTGHDFEKVDHIIVPDDHRGNFLVVERYGRITVEPVSDKQIGVW